MTGESGYGPERGSVEPSTAGGIHRRSSRGSAERNHSGHRRDSGAGHEHHKQALFDGHYGQMMYFPLVMCDGKTGELLGLRLRSGRAHDKHRAKPMIRRVIKRFNEEFPDTELRFRADDGFTDARIYRLLDGASVAWNINYAANEVLKERTNERLNDVREQYEQKEEKVTEYELLEDYQAYSWDRSRWGAAKIEYGPQGANRRFVVCSEQPESAKAAFEMYEQRGVCEQYIREFKGGYREDKLSCHRFVANAFRLVLYGIAYTMVVRFFRNRHLTGTELEGSWIQTIREKLFKLGARIKVMVRRCWIHASREWPYQTLFQRVAASVCPQPG